MSFKDTILGEILTYCLKATKELFLQMSSLQPEQKQMMLGLLLQCLKVTNSCVSFDFAGRFDDTLDNLTFNQMPLTWSSVLLNTDLLQVIFDIAFTIASQEHQVLVMLRG